MEEGKHVVFLKILGRVLSPDNIESAVTIITLQGAPLGSFHSTLHGVFIPLLRETSAQEPQLEQLAAALDASLRRVLNSDDNPTNVLCKFFASKLCTVEMN